MTLSIVQRGGVNSVDSIEQPKPITGEDIEAETISLKKKQRLTNLLGFVIYVISW